MTVRAEAAEISTGVDEAALHRRTAQHLDCPVDGESLRDPPQVDPDARVSEPHVEIGEQLDGGAGAGRCRTRKVVVLPRQEPERLQRGRDRDVEHAVRSPVEIPRRLQNLVGPRMHADRRRDRAPVETAHVAGRIVEAHQPVHRRDGVEGLVDGRVHRGRRATGDGDLDEGAEQRAGAAHAT